MVPRPALPPRSRRILQRAREDRRAAAAELDSLRLEEQVELVGETPASRRAELLDLMPSPERVIPRLPDAELCFTVLARGLADAGWMLEYATDEQVVAALDLDAWTEEQIPDRERLSEWLEAAAECGFDTLLRAARALDPELLCLHLKDRIHVLPKPPDDPDWSPPPGWDTLEGQLYFTARRPGDDLQPVIALLRALFEGDYWLYFRLMQSVLVELETETEEWALRWRTGRLQDLGFPPRDEALAVYAYLPPERRAELPADEKPFDVSAWPLPVWMPELPAEPDSRHLLFRAVARLDEEERRAFLYAFVSLVNRVAVAERMPLSDADSVPRAAERAAAAASRGLEFLAGRTGLEAPDVLRRVSLDRLFRVGVNLERDAEPRS